MGCSPDIQEYGILCADPINPIDLGSDWKFALSGGKKIPRKSQSSNNNNECNMQMLMAELFGKQGSLDKETSAFSFNSNSSWGNEPLCTFETSTSLPLSAVRRTGMRSRYSLGSYHFTLHWLQLSYFWFPSRGLSKESCCQCFFFSK